MSNDTFWPSPRVLRPAASTAEAWTKTSLPPSSGAMKPNPLEALKNFTVPMVMICPLKHRVPAARHASPAVGTKHLGLGVFGSSGALGRVRKTEELRLTGTQEPRPLYIGVPAHDYNGANELFAFLP